MIRSSRNGMAWPGVVSILCAAAALLAAVPVGRGQPPSTAPDMAGWQQTVRGAADALAGGSDADVAALLRFDTVIRRFGGGPREPIEFLRTAARGTTVLSARVYPWTGGEIATDLASDFRAAAIPDALKRKLIPPEEADLRRANATAMRWVEMTVAPAEGEMIGVVVLWVAAPPVNPGEREESTPDSGLGHDVTRSPAAEPGAPPRAPAAEADKTHADDAATDDGSVVFVLFKSEPVPTAGGPRIRAVVWGDPVLASAGAGSSSASGR